MLGSDSLVWLSDRDGELGTGSTREVTLSEGTHTITLVPAGSTVSATTTVVVETAPSPPPKSYAYLPLVIL